MPDIWMDVDIGLSEVPVNKLPLIDDTDFKSKEESIAYNESGMDLVWNFVTTAGAMAQTAVTPTTGGDYDWASQGNGMYSIEIPASGGASINNDTEGFGWFTGVCDGVLPWAGPVIGFRAAGLNNALIDSAYSATRGLAGTALPDAAADAAGGLPISDAGGIDLDTLDSNVSAVLNDTGTDGVVVAAASKTGYALSAAGNTAVIDEFETQSQADPTGFHVNVLEIESTDATDQIENSIDNEMEKYKLDHLVYQADSDDVADNSILGKLASTDGDWSNLSETTDSLQSARDALGNLLAISNILSLSIDADGYVLVDLKKINGTTLTGDGGGTPWGPA